MTASALAADRDRCLEAGMDDYLSKPVWDAHLASALNRLAGHGPAVGQEPDELEPGIREELVAAYVEMMAPRVDELIEQLRSGSAAEVVSLTHDLRPTSASVGAYHLSELLTEVEDIALTRPDQLPTLAPRLAEEHRHAMRELAR
jgi:HPt (histidine-containing phosphotransfer) domain-containing protein